MINKSNKNGLQRLNPLFAKKIIFDIIRLSCTTLQFQREG